MFSDNLKELICQKYSNFEFVSIKDDGFYLYSHLREKDHERELLYKHDYKYHQTCLLSMTGQKMLHDEYKTKMEYICPELNRLSKEMGHQFCI